MCIRDRRNHVRLRAVSRGGEQPEQCSLPLLAASTSADQGIARECVRVQLGVGELLLHKDGLEP
eukprot:1021238-Alexandrium_andersonii.AAC.1